MPQYNSVDAFHRTLQERYEAAKAAVDGTIQTFAGSADANARKQKAEHLHRAVLSLRSLLHGRDRPPWLKPIIATSHAFVVNPDDSNGRLLIRSIVDHYPSIKPIAVDGDGIQPLDFDRIFAESRDSGELPHLFDELIALAEKIIQSGEIESLTALSALKYLIRTLEENRNGSYLAVSQSISLAAYFKNLLDVYLEKIPGIAEHREAYARTVRQAEQELQKTKQEIRDKISEEVRERLPKLGRLAEIAEQIDVLLPPASLPAPSPATDETDIGDQ